MTTAINSATAAGANFAAAGGGSIGKDATEDRFLKLLIAQMRNQDPLNPLDNAAVTSQMAQINTVQGISQLNASMSAMLAQFQGAQAISLPGRQVLIDGNALTLATTGTGVAAKGGFELAQDVERVTIEVKDAQGNIVTQLNLGAQSAGASSFSWNGQRGNGVAAEGNYTFEVKAWNGATSVPVGALRAVRVEGAAITSQGVRLTLEGLGSRFYSDVRMVL